MKILDINGVSILWQRIKTIFAKKSETVSDISRNDTTFTVTRADGSTFQFTQKDTTYNNATTSTAGLMSAADKVKLDSVENGAQENIVESVSVNGTKQTVTNKGINIIVPTAVSDLNNDLGYLSEESDPTVPSWAKQAQKPVYTASEVGALSADTKIPTKVSDLTDDSGHYTKPSGGIPSTDLSSDILAALEKADTVVQDVSDVQDAIAELTEKLNTLADSDDTTLDQMSEIVAYIKNNKSLIDGITTGKVSVTDIVDSLTSSATNKPLSAKQGKILKDLIDGIVIPTKVSDLQNDSHYIDASGAPVQSVNGQTGDVTITAAGIGALTQHQDISGKANIADLATVATSGNYNDLSNKPTIPSKTSDLTNDVGYLTTETDPTVPSWAKASTKPTYTASEVGALPDDTDIPTKTSDLTNDSGFITGTTILSYGSSTWNDFITAYNANKVVYCRASSNANPATGSQTRLAFMAYVNNGAAPTSVEFQYYRSVSSHSASQQGDQVFVYTLTSAGTWSVTVREAASKIAAGTNMSSSYSDGTLTLNCNGTVVTNVSGASPVITAEADTRYICGEVTSLSFTPCASGICDVRFTSGSTVTVLTLPNTVKMPEWFDATSLETNTIYEINILDGVYGVVTTWAV